MAEVKSGPGILDVIKSITANRESGRLEISSPGMYGSGTHGVLLFTEGKLVDARLESLSGFQAVNAVVALPDVEFNFDHVAPAPQVVSITPSERVVLKQFFGIETAEMEEPVELVEADPGWNETPEQVVPLAEVEEFAPASNAKRFGNSRRFAFLLRPQIAVGLVLLFAVVVGAVALRSKYKTRQQSETTAANVVATPEPASAPVAVSQPQQSDVHDLNGEWRLINTVEKTNYKAFHHLQLGFRLKINQTGTEFTAQGEKFSENGQTLPANSRTPIQLTGSIDGDTVVATFVEDGQRRRSNGRFVWKLQSDDRLTGTFISNAGNNSGTSAVTKEE